MVAQFDYYTTTVILSGAVFQAERRISRFTGATRKPKCTTTKNPRLDCGALGSLPYLPVIAPCFFKSSIVSRSGSAFTVCPFPVTSCARNIEL